MHLGVFSIRHWLLMYSHPGAFSFRVLMHLGFCYIRHELLVYTHPSAFSAFSERPLMHVPGILRIADPMATENLMIAVPHARRAVSRRMFFGLPSRDLTLRQPYRDPEGFAISGTSCWVFI